MKRTLLTGILPAFLVAAAVSCCGQSNVYSLTIPGAGDRIQVVDHNWLVGSSVVGSRGEWGFMQTHSLAHPSFTLTTIYYGSTTRTVLVPIWLLGLRTLLGLFGIIGMIWLAASVIRRCRHRRDDPAER
jgi:hypothetical protein